MLILSGRLPAVEYRYLQLLTKTILITIAVVELFVAIAVVHLSQMLSWGLLAKMSGEFETRKVVRYT